MNEETYTSVVNNMRLSEVRTPFAMPETLQHEDVQHLNSIQIFEFCSKFVVKQAACSRS